MHPEWQNSEEVAYEDARAPVLGAVEQPGGVSGACSPEGVPGLVSHTEEVAEHALGSGEASFGG